MSYFYKLVEVGTIGQLLKICVSILYGRGWGEGGVPLECSSPTWVQYYYTWKPTYYSVGVSTSVHVMHIILI